MMYWAYLHQSGHIHLRSHYKDSASKTAMNEARRSPFVDDVVGPFWASSRNEALQIARETWPSFEIAPNPPAPPLNAARLEAEARRADAEDSAPRRGPGETW